jgi:hypothetical protein
MAKIDITKYKGLASSLHREGEDYFKIVLAWFYPTKTGMGGDGTDRELMNLIESAQLEKYGIYSFVGVAPREMEELLFNELDDDFRKNNMAYDFGFTLQRSATHPQTNEDVGRLDPGPKLQALFGYLKDNYYNLNLSDQVS